MPFALFVALIAALPLYAIVSFLVIRGTTDQTVLGDAVEATFRGAMVWFLTGPGFIVTATVLA